MGRLDGRHLALAQRGVGLQHAEAQDGLRKVLCGKEVHERVLAQREAVGLPDHPGVLVFEGADVALKGADFGVRTGHVVFEGAQFLLVVPKELLAEADFLVHKLELLHRVRPVRLRRLQEPLGGGELFVQGVAPPGELVLCLALRHAGGKHERDDQTDCKPALRTKYGAPHRRAIQKAFHARYPP